MKHIILGILSFFIIFNSNSLSYAQGFSDQINFNTNILSFSFDNKSITINNSFNNDFVSNNLNQLNPRNQFLDYSLQLGVGLLTGAILGFAGVFIGFSTVNYFENLSGPANQIRGGTPVLSVLIGILFSFIFYSIGSSIGINSVSKSLLSKEGNIWISIITGIAGSLLFATIFGFAGLFVGDFTKQYIAAFLLAGLVTTVEIVTINLTAKEVDSLSLN